jgi:hypothetical protein
MIVSGIVKPVVKQGVRLVVVAAEVAAIVVIADLALTRVSLKPWQKAFWTNNPEDLNVPSKKKFWCKKR